MSQIELCPTPESASATLATDAEFANTLTHGIGLLISLAGAVFLATILPSVETGLAVSCKVYLASLLAVYAFSTLSHAVQQPQLKHRFRIWDQGLIYTLIAGTYTPFMWTCLPPHYRWPGLLLLWSATGVGFYTKVVIQHRVNSTTTYSYILLGWLPAMTMLHRISLPCLGWLAAGGVCYTIGTLFLKADNRHRYFHATWHVLVILGSTCHYFAILLHVVLPNVTA